MPEVQHEVTNRGATTSHQPNNDDQIILDSVGESLEVELSGAHADVWAWHFILHASAPAKC